jgi:MoxR-like ATPase
MVMATQNPIEYEGTYPLPEAELDRFSLRLSIGYPPLEHEARMIDAQAQSDPLDVLKSVASAEDVLNAIYEARAIFVESSLSEYVVTLMQRTRVDRRLYLGASPRAGITLLRVAKARALAAGRDHVTPHDVKAVAPHVLSHRLILAPEARASGIETADLVRELVDRTPVPA